MLFSNNYVGRTWDAEVDLRPRTRYDNAELTLYIRVHLRQRNPAGNAAQGTAPDASGAARNILRWTDAAWLRWTRTYAATAQRFWNGKFWLITPDGCADLDFVDRGQTYRPNVWTRFSLTVVPTAANAHTTIDVVRLAPTEAFFRSHSRLYDTRDLAPADKGARMPQRAHVHEVGHLLGLGHSAQHRNECLSTGNTNSPICYGTTAEEVDDAMGGGMVLAGWHSDPWRKAIAAITQTSEHIWAPMQSRHYPRSVEDLGQRRYPTLRPQRD